MAPITFSPAPRAALAAQSALVASRVYNALLLVGFFGLLAVLAAALLSPNVRRSGAWINFYLTAVLYAVSYLLLFFAGQGVAAPPSFDLCLIQAAMTYAVCALCSCSALVLSFTMWMGVCKPTTEQTLRVKLAGIILPWIMWLGILLMSIGFGVSDQDGVHLTRSLYCEIENRVPARASQALVALSFLVNVVFQALTFRGLWKLRIHDAAAEEQSQSYFSIAVRMLFWNITTIVEVILIYILLAQPTQDNRVCLVQASLPLLAFTAFGTRKDVFSAWFPCFLRPKNWKEIS